jgi:hypothetical protein
MSLTLHSVDRRFTGRALLVVLLLPIGLLVTPAIAGGSWEPVRVLKILRTNETAYTLVVEPDPNNDSYLGGCRRFEVHGTLSRLEGKKLPFGRSGAPTKEQHVAALRYLQSFERTGRPVNFGWMGEGFRIIDPKKPCVFMSRGLRIIDGAVVSYFHMT